MDEKPIVDPFPTTTEVHEDEETGNKEVKWGETVVGVIADDSDVNEVTIDENGIEGGALTQEQEQKRQQEREAAKREKSDDKEWKPVE